MNDAYLARQGAPTVDGSDELLYFLRDPQTNLRLRLPTPIAHVFSALKESPADATTADVARFVSANFGVSIAEADVERHVRLLRALDLRADKRELATQLAGLHAELDARKKREVLRRLPEIARTIPFYSGYAADVASFEDIPIIGKSELREHVHRLHVAEEGAKYVWMSSSGTTGERVQAPHIGALFHDLVLPHFALAEPTLDSDSRWFLFMPAECGGMACNMNPDTTIEERTIGNQLLAPQLGNPTVARSPQLEKCARDVLAWQPAVMTGSPSFMYAFARYAESVNLKLPSLRAIFYHVEPASVLHTRKIEQVFGVAGRSLYIASELGWPAVEWIPGRLFSSPTHIVEVVRDGRPAKPGEIGNVVVTRTFHGSATLLRYDTRDLARLSPDGLSTGRLLGRPNTALVQKPDGGAVPSDVLDNAVAEASADAIAYYRLYRRGTTSAPRFVLECCASGQGDPARAVKAIEETLRELLGTAVDVRSTKGIPPHRGGRMPFFLDEGE